jgi:curli biogenesis system outer membrane secretion channel CsgG
MKMFVIGAAAALISGAAFGQFSQMQMGSDSAKTEATGSAGGANAQNANKSLERCSETLGTVTIEEDQTQPWFYSLQQYQLGPTTPVLKMLLQQSNCFVVVERGKAMRNMQQERELAAAGELRHNSKMHKGQMVAADYIVEPSVTFSNSNAGGLGGLIGGTFGGSLGAALGGSMNTKEASTMLTLIDSRSGVQLAAAEGSARNMDFGAIGGLLGAHGGGALGGYSNTAQGKVVVAAFTDSVNNLIKAVKDYKAQEVKGGLGAGGRLKVN